MACLGVLLAMVILFKLKIGHPDREKSPRIEA